MTEENFETEQARTVVGRFVIGPADLERAVADQGFAKLGWALMLMAVLMVAASLWWLGPAFFRAVAPALIFVVVFWFYFRHVQKKANARSFEGKGPGDSDTRLELDDVGYATITASSSTRGTWQSLNGFQEGKSCFLLFAQPRGVVILPKRAFSEADVSRVREILHAHVTAQPAPVSKARLRAMVALMIISISLIAGIFYYLNRKL